MAILIESADYVVRDADRVERGVDVLLEGARIAAVGRIPRGAPGDLQVIRGSGFALIPGFVNAHAHLYQSFLKGLRDDLSLVDWCNATLYPLAYAVHQEYNGRGIDTSGYHWAMLSALELIHGGVTCCADMNLNMDSVPRAWLEIGLRGVAAIALADRWLPAVLRQDPESAKAEALRMAKEWCGIHPRIQVVLAPSTPFLCSRELLEWSRDRAADLSIGLQIHLAETRYEIEQVRKETGLTPVAYAGSLGLLCPRTTSVHCVHVCDGDIEVLAESGTTVVHCPKSNLKLGSGIAPVPQMLARGVRVALATDGAASNDNLDMLEEMRVAALLHKGHWEDPSALTARQVFRMATQGGAAALGIDAGTIDPGKLADLVLIKLDRPHLMPLHDVINTIVYCSKSSDVQTVIIDGKIVMRDGVLLTVDEGEVLNAAVPYGRSLYERGLSMWGELDNG